MKAGSSQILDLIHPNEIYKSMEYLVKMFGGLYRNIKELRRRTEQLEQTISHLETENQRLSKLLEAWITDEILGRCDGSLTLMQRASLETDARPEMILSSSKERILATGVAKMSR